MLLHKNTAVYFSFLLVIVFMLQASMNTIIYFRFKLNQTYITTELCVKRFDTKSNCKGACYLKSQLKKTTSGKSALAQYVKYKTDLYAESVLFMAAKELCRYEKLYGRYLFFNLKEGSTDFFHPPA